MLEGLVLAVIDHHREPQVGDLLVPIEDRKHPVLPLPLALNTGHPVSECDRVRLAQWRDAGGEQTAGIGKAAYALGGKLLVARDSANEIRLFFGWRAGGIVPERRTA